MLLQCCGCAANNVKCDCDFVAATSWQDVTIVFFICAAIVVIATYGTCKFFKNKAKERECQKERESQKHNWDVENEERKQKVDLQNKLIDFLEKNTSKDVNSGEAGKLVKTLRGLDSKESQYYLSVILSLISNETIPDNPKDF